MIKHLAMGLLGMTLLLAQGELFRQEAHSAAGAARLTAVTGIVQRKMGATWQKAFSNLPVNAGDSIRTGLRSRTEIRYNNGTVTRMGANTMLRVTGPVDMRLLSGKTWIQKPKNAQQMKIRTPIAVASILGTELFISHNEKNTSHVTTLDGVVEVTGMMGDKQTVNPGEWVEIEPDKPLEKPTKFDWNELKKKERFLLDPTFIPPPDSTDDGSEDDWK